MEHQYLELFADAPWKRRRLSRIEAQVWEDVRLDEDMRLTKLERLDRLPPGAAPPRVAGAGGPAQQRDTD